MRFLADENFNGKLLAGLRAALPGLDVTRVQDINMDATPDPQLLAWAAEQNRILLTHDIQTIAGYAYERVRPVYQCQASLRSGLYRVSARPSTSLSS